MIRYGIAGFGLHAVKRLMPGFAKARSSKVVALSRRNLEQGRADAAHYGIEHAFATTEELCQCPEVDAVIVSSPNALHLADVLMAVRHGKAVLCEKPMALNAMEAEQMAAAAKERGGMLGIAQCFRFEDTVRRIRERVQRKEIGEILSIRIDFTFDGTASPRKWLHDAALAGGGPIPDLGVHTIDAMRAILGDEPTEVSAWTHSDQPAGGVETSAVLNLRFSKGATGSSYVSFRSPYQSPIEIYGTGGLIFARDGLNTEHPVTVEVRKPGGVETEELSNAATYTRQVDAFSEALEGGAPFSVPAAEGVRNQKILDAFYRSARSGRAEAV